MDTFFGKLLMGSAVRGMCWLSAKLALLAPKMILKSFLEVRRINMAVVFLTYGVPRCNTGSGPVL